MSMDASGKFAGTLVFSKWKGRPTVRQLVRPSNPRSQLQQDARNAMRVLAESQRWINATSEMRPGQTMTDKALLISLAPAGQAWNGYLVKSGIGTAQLNYTTAADAYAGLDQMAMDGWEANALLRNPPFRAVATFDKDGIEGDTKSPGEVMFHTAYALYVAGAMAAAPGTNVPGWA
jgi:hypothetical protein